MRKKSQLSAQFAWIFVLIAGTIILIFFISLVYKQKAISEQKLSAKVLNQLETIITGAGLSPGTSKPIDTPELEINFVCDEDGYSDYSIKGLAKETPRSIIFAPDIIKGKKVLAWALSWDVPFRAANFLYLSDPNIKYVLINPPSAITRDLPEDFNIEISSAITGISTKGLHKLKLVLFETQAPVTITNPYPDVEVSAVNIALSTITFYTKNTLAQEDSISYLDSSSLYGAVFSQDAVSYKCNMKKASKKLNLLSQIYASRQEELKIYFDTIPTPQLCHLLYHTDSNDALPSLVSHSAQCNENINTCIDDIKFDLQQIEQEQNILIRKSCPLLY